MLSGMHKTTDRSLSGDAFRNKIANVGRNKNKKANGRSSWTHVSARFCAAGFSHVPICHGKRQISLAWKSAKKEGALRRKRMRRISFRQESATLFVQNLVLLGEVTISPIAIPRRD